MCLTGSWLAPLAVGRFTLRSSLRPLDWARGRLFGDDEAEKQRQNAKAKATAVPSTAPFANCANGSAQDDTFWGG